MAAVPLAVMRWSTFCSHDSSITAIAQESLSNFGPAYFAGVALLPSFRYDQLKSAIQ